MNDCLAPHWDFPDLGTDPSVRDFVRSYAALITQVAIWEDSPGPISATIDHTPVANLTAYRAQAPSFDVTTPSCNIVGVPWPGIGPCGTAEADTYGPNGSDGYWLMLHPLTPGAHTIRLTAGDPAWLDVTYNFTVGR